MRRFLAVIAFLAFLLSITIHTATYFGFNAGEEFPAIWILHIVALVFLIFVGRTLRGEKNWNKILEPIPLWGRTLLGICMVYTIINFVLFFIAEIGEGVPQRLHGQYTVYRIEAERRAFIDSDDANSTELETVTLDGMPVERKTEGTISVFFELTEEEYYQRTLPNLRGFTGHWMLFLLIPALYYWYEESP